MKLARLFVINQGKSNMNSTRIFNIYVEMIIRKQGCHAELLPFKERYKNIKQETVMLSPQSKAPYRDSQILGNTAQRRRRSRWGAGVGGGCVLGICNVHMSILSLYWYTDLHSVKNADCLVLQMQRRFSGFCVRLCTKNPSCLKWIILSVSEEIRHRNRQRN